MLIFRGSNLVFLLYKNNITNVNINSASVLYGAKGLCPTQTQIICFSHILSILFEIKYIYNKRITFEEHVEYYIYLIGSVVS